MCTLWDYQDKGGQQLLLRSLKALHWRPARHEHEDAGILECSLDMTDRGNKVNIQCKAWMGEWSVKYENVHHHPAPPPSPSPSPLLVTMGRSSRVTQRPRGSGLESDACQRQRGNVTHERSGKEVKVAKWACGVFSVMEWRESLGFY